MTVGAVTQESIMKITAENAEYAELFGDYSASLRDLWDLCGEKYGRRKGAGRKDLRNRARVLYNTKS
jgi:hypothetical protein